MYNVQEVVRKLGLTSDAWLVLAVVTRNDYCNPVRGLGIKSNMEIIQSIWSFKTLSKEVLLQRYCDKVAASYDIHGLSTASYEPATDVFFHHHEDLVPYPAIGRGLEEEVATVIHEVGLFRQMYRQQRQLLSTPVKEPAAVPPPGVGVGASDEVACLGAPFAAPFAAPIYAPLPLVAPVFDHFMWPTLTPGPAASATGPSVPMDAAMPVLVGPPPQAAAPPQAVPPQVAAPQAGAPALTSASRAAQRPHQKL
ncbi:hypothetical protein BGZ72_003042, partial [Mortierella alpina]